MAQKPRVFGAVRLALSATDTPPTRVNCFAVMLVVEHLCDVAPVRVSPVGSSGSSAGLSRGILFGNRVSKAD